MSRAKAEGLSNCAGRGNRAVLGQALLSIMVEFWLLDSEAPQPGAAAASAAAAAQHQQQQARAMRSLLSSSLLRYLSVNFMQNVALCAYHCTHTQPSHRCSSIVQLSSVLSSHIDRLFALLPSPCPSDGEFFKQWTRGPCRGLCMSSCCCAVQSLEY